MCTLLRNVWWCVDRCLDCRMWSYFLDIPYIFKIPPPLPSLFWLHWDYTHHTSHQTYHTNLPLFSLTQPLQIRSVEILSNSENWKSSIPWGCSEPTTNHISSHSHLSWTLGNPWWGRNRVIDTDTCAHKHTHPESLRPLLFPLLVCLFCCDMWSDILPYMS